MHLEIRRRPEQNAAPPALPSLLGQVQRAVRVQCPGDGFWRGPSMLTWPTYERPLLSHMTLKAGRAITHPGISILLMLGPQRHTELQIFPVSSRTVGAFATPSHPSLDQSPKGSWESNPEAEAPTPASRIDVDTKQGVLDDLGTCPVLAQTHAPSSDMQTLPQSHNAGASWVLLLAPVAPASSSPSPAPARLEAIT